MKIRNYHHFSCLRKGKDQDCKKKLIEAFSEEKEPVWKAFSK